MPFAEISGLQIYYDDLGKGVPVLAIHGLGGSSNFWWPLHTALAETARIIAPDMPSSGRSSCDAELSIDRIADVMLQLLDHLELPKVHLLGHSMGTIVCQAMAARAPDKFHTIALLGPLAEPPDPARPNIAARADLAREQGMPPIADAIVGAALASETRASKPVATAFVRELVAAQNAEGYAQSCLALAKATAANVSGVACPALLITGDQDGVAPPANVEALAGQFSNLVANTVLAECGHWTILEQPEAVTTALQDLYSD